MRISSDHEKGGEGGQYFGPVPVTLLTRVRRHTDADLGTEADIRLSVFGAGSGWLSASGGLLWSVDMSRDWVVVGSLEGQRLQGDAAQSPLAERGLNHYLSVGMPIATDAADGHAE